MDSYNIINTQLLLYMARSLKLQFNNLLANTKTVLLTSTGEILYLNKKLPEGKSG